MIYKTNFQSTSNMEEFFGDTGEKISFRCQYSTGDNLRGSLFPWHWHSAFEIDLVTGCDIRFDFEGTSLNISQGNAVFINSQKIHSYQPENSVKYKTYALLFEPLFLAGQYNEEIFQKYIVPVMNSNISGLEILASDSAFACIKEIIDLAEKEPEYFEIQIRIQLEKLWCMILDKVKGEKVKVSVRKEDSERMKQMLNYIHSHYAEKLSLEKIASAASIGIRECSRCFDRSIRQSPMNYVSQYRVQMALELLMTTGYTITEISEMCGFSSVSYFGKVFHKYMSVTPVQYRAQLEKLTY